MPRRLIAALAAVATVSALGFTARPVLAATPGDEHVFQAGAPVTALSTNPSFFPATFDPAVHDYAIYCTTGINTIQLTINVGTPRSVQVLESQAIVVKDNAGQEYWIRCLPHDFPRIQHTGQGDAGEYYLSATINGAKYAFILDQNATPIWYQNAPLSAVDFERLDSTLDFAWYGPAGPVSADWHENWRVYNDNNQFTSMVMAPILPTDAHEYLPLSNGDRMLISTPLVTGSVPAAIGGGNSYVDCVLEEVAPNGSTVWTWRGSQHVSLNESIPPLASAVNYDGQTAVDAYHCNSIDVDPNNPDHVLASFRHDNAIYEISKSSGKILWKLEGNSVVGPDNEAQMTASGDSENGISGQHDARFQVASAGTEVVSLYDDHSHACASPPCPAGQPGPGVSRGVVFTVDDTAHTAAWTRDFKNPAKVPAPATGSFRVYDGGNSNLVDWGFTLSNPSVTEFNAAGTTTFSLSFQPAPSFAQADTYRTFRESFTPAQVEALRHSAGLPRPSTTTGPFEEIGGILWGKPAVTAWHAETNGSETDRIDVFVRGNDTELWQNTWQVGSVWQTNWTPVNVPGGSSMMYGPAAVSTSQGHFEVFGVGSNGAVWHTSSTDAGGGWSPQTSLGGIATSAPSALVVNGKIWVFVRGQDNALWYQVAGDPSGWHSGGGILTADPAAATNGSGQPEVFVRGQDNALWHEWWNGSSFSGWYSLGGALLSGPAAVSNYQGQMDIVAEGTDGQVWRREYEQNAVPNNYGWGGWMWFGPTATTTTASYGINETPALVSREVGTEELFVRSADPSAACFNASCAAHMPLTP